MDFLNWLSSNKDIITVVISMFALLISTISIIFSAVSIHNQIIHNKNSVLPLCEINPLDYENKLAISIHNNGTGPLIIIKLSCYYKDRCEDALINLFPQIDQYWNTFTGPLNGETIPVNGKRVLIDISPKDEKTKQKIRDILSKVKIEVKYRDIYNTEFSYSKSMDFFKRNCNKFNT